MGEKKKAKTRKGKRGRLVPRAYNSINYLNPGGKRRQGGEGTKGKDVNGRGANLTLKIPAYRGRLKYIGTRSQKCWEYDRGTGERKVS